MLAEGIASGRLGPRPECVAHGRARARSPTGSRVRFVALSSRLLSVFLVFPPADTIRHHAAWPARPAGAVMRQLPPPADYLASLAPPSGGASRSGSRRGAWRATILPSIACLWIKRYCRPWPRRTAQLDEVGRGVF